MRFELVKNLIVVDVAVNGSSVPMILDTGAATTVVCEQLARELKLERNDVTCEGMGAGGNVEFSSVNIKSFQVGGVTLNELTGMTMDMNKICQRMDRKVGGIVGHNFLANMRLTVDYPNQALWLEGPADSTANC